MSTTRMKRDECFRVLARHVGDAIVVAAYSSAVEWEGIAPRALNYYSVGAMGLSGSHGLGLALAFPERRVIVLDGDGSLLMNLGCLVSIAAAAPRNFVHLVCNNGCYEANGSQPIPNPDVDFTALARAAGYAATFEFSELGTFTQQAGHLLEQSGPVFATLHVERTRPLTYDYRALYAEEKRRALKAAVQAG
jgi:thiamine pyrophosphate-dependent acetolactate synthase large subunit-like protein